jgi:two-component system sensor histidine kinase BaeS
MHAETELLQRLIDDFQELAVSDAGQLQINAQSLSLRETLTNILVPLTQPIAATFKMQVPDSLVILADEQRIRQVLGNLVENAARHQPTELVISVVATRSGDRVVIRFTDNGPGIAKVDQPHIFERFYRAEKSRNRASGGSGLGLPIVQAIMEAMGGSIRFVDSPGQASGAEFELSFPASP